MAVLPVEYRTRLIGADCKMSRLAEAEKELAEAKQAVLLDAPEHQKLKEVSEGIASLFRLMPEQVGPLMTMVTSMLGLCDGKYQKWRKPVCVNRTGLQMQIVCTHCRRNNGKNPRYYHTAVHKNITRDRFIRSVNPIVAEKMRAIPKN